MTLKIVLVLLACGAAAALSAAFRVRKLPPSARRHSPTQAAVRAGLLAVAGAAVGVAVAIWRAA